jgi:hypothetical protein
MKSILSMTSVVAIVAFALHAPIASAQTDPYYMSDGDGRRIIVVQGGAIVDSFPAVPAQRAFPIAIVNEVRTTGYAQGETGGEYLLDGTPTGNTYPLMQGNIMSDGTTNGDNINYGISFTGEVWQYDRDWDNGIFLFNSAASDGIRKAGIAYDPSDGTLWLSADRAAGMYHYALDGTLLGSFPTAGNLDWNLALEPSTDTLWVSTFQNETLHHYAKDGTDLGDIVVPGMRPSSFFSGEFQFNFGPQAPRCTYQITARPKFKSGTCGQPCNSCPYNQGDLLCTIECETSENCRLTIKGFNACDGGGACKIKAGLVGCAEPDGCRRCG